MENKFKFWLGSLLMLTGAFFLLSNLIFPLNVTQVLFSWPMLLVAIGGLLLIYHFFWALWPLAIGLYFLVPKIYGALGVEFPLENAVYTSALWALLLILLGLTVIFGSSYRLHRHRFRHWMQSSVRSNEDDLLQVLNTFGETKHKVLTKPFVGATIQSSFGSVVLNLRDTELLEGDTLVSLNSTFSGITIIVPESWTVVTNVKAFFGGAANEYSHKSKLHDDTKRLIIEGSVLFGGVEIKRKRG